MSNERNINLKHLLDGIGELRHHADEIYKSLKAQLGEEATFIKEWYDLKRVQMDDPDATELEGDVLLPDILIHCFQKKADYIWHYNGLRIRLTPFRSTDGDSGFIMYYGDGRSEVTFNSVVETIVEYGESVWGAMTARIYGIADGHIAGLKHVLSDQPAPDAEPDLKWRDGYSVDPAEVVKVPDGADAVPDGTLACADPEPVVDQTEEPVAGQEEKVYKPQKNLIRAGGNNVLPDGNSDMTDSEKAEYRRWKESQEDF